jgi:hypothetical protein
MEYFLKETNLETQLNIAQSLMIEPPSIMATLFKLSLKAKNWFIERQQSADEAWNRPSGTLGQDDPGGPRTWAKSLAQKAKIFRQNS